ncbi:hypothetical protein J2X31_000354 [Flavobacterium arsenatis]|uniref:Uncharacterized protein n=1 Tax=Flavobacterium arsenatis TaxID=1484332 RepID=A0ABU1TK49_9FLAO|nr:hypothetical protein [Flavobacterium arsenatis]
MHFTVIWSNFVSYQLDKFSNYIENATSTAKTLTILLINPTNPVFTIIRSIYSI